MAWRQFVMPLGALPAQEVEALFFRHGAQAVTFSDGGDVPVLEPAPGETPLWPDTTVTGLFAEDADTHALAEDLKATFALAVPPPHRVETLAERAWEREWLRYFRPLRFGRRLWVHPGDGTVDDPAAVVVRLDPGLAFGTGTHPTTALALKWLDGLDLDGRRVLDFGCGSGILAIAALRLGARTAVACDIDPQALLATRDNARRNAVGERLAVVPDAPPPRGDFDVVLANILADTLVREAATLAAHLRPGGRLLLSGILEHQVESVLAAYRTLVDFDPPAVRESWVRMTGRKT